MGHKLKYLGIDISKSFLKIAKSRYPQINFQQADISDKSTLPKLKFDGFWAGAVLMHVPFTKWDEMLSNIESITKKGAYGYISLPTEHPSIEIVSEDIRHFTTLPDIEQQNIIKKAGLEN
jgi:trans-aconitate methyltransferase